MSSWIDFPRVQNWKNTEEIIGLSCSLCDSSDAKCKDGKLTGIFRDLDNKVAREAGSSLKVHWDLAFQTPVLRKNVSKPAS